METRELGKSGLKISRLGFGCAPMGSYDYGKVDDNESFRAVRRALDLGINFFDTADVYGFGHAEEVLGKALGKDREKVVIATKFGLSWDASGNIRRDCGRGRVFEAVEESLRRLKVDCISLYQIHWPDYHTPIEETMEALLACKERGKIMHIGCSNFTVEFMKKAERAGRLESLQAAYNLLSRGIEGNVSEYCRDKRISIMVHSALARGLLAGKYKIGHQFEAPDTRRFSPYFEYAKREGVKNLLNELAVMAEKYGRPQSQVAIRWILDNPVVTCTIAGMKTAAQVEENFGALEWSLSKEDRDLLASCSDRCDIQGLFAADGQR